MRNILYIMLDQLRHDALGFAGTFPVRTPHIDRLAAGGTTFTNAYCTNPLCTPARASLMTGCYSCDNGVYYNDQNWPESLATYPARLAANGYYTVQIGKTHFRPNRRVAGFQKLIVQDDYDEYLKRLGRYTPPLEGKVSDAGHINRDYPLEPTRLPLELYEPVFFTDRALHELDLIARRRECRVGENEPFLLQLSYMQPHTPCDPPEPYFSLYDPDDLPPPVRDEREPARFPRQLRRFYEIWRQLDEERAHRTRAQYLGCVTLLDEQIGRVIAKLEELELMDNTLIVFTSDHGDHLSDHYLQQKGFFYDCSAKVPLILSGPELPGGATVAANVSHIDLFPTLMEYSSLAMPRYRGPDGRFIYPDVHESDAESLLPLLRGEEAPHTDRVIVSENAALGHRIMLKQGHTKVNYYINADGRDEIERYDLVADPGEIDNQGDGLTVDDLSGEMRTTLDSVRARAARHAGGHYFFQDKIRPMFT